MTFLNPTALILLTSIGFPILIHFLNRFNVKKVDYSSIRYLKTMENNSIRRLKLKKLLLLLLRIGIISALVLMLSRPVTKGFVPGWLSSEIDSKLLIVIDNSASMSAEINGQTLLENGKKAAIDLLGNYGKNTSVNIIQTCPPKNLYSGMAYDENNKSIINHIKPTKDYDNIWSVVDSLTKNLDVFEQLRE